MKITVSYVEAVIPCSLVTMYWHFGGTYCLHLLGKITLLPFNGGQHTRILEHEKCSYYWIIFLLMCSTPLELLCSRLHSSSLVSCKELYQSPSLSSLLSYLLELATWNVNKVIYSYWHQHSGITTWKINHKQLFPSSLQGLNTIRKTHWIHETSKSVPMSSQQSLNIKSHRITQVENYPHGISRINPLTQDNDDANNHAS